MKRSIPLLLLIIPLTLGAKQLSKKEILQHAFNHAEELTLIKKELASAQSMEKEYRGKGFPTIEASVNYKLAPKQYNPYSFDIGGGGDGVLGLMDPTQPGFMNDATIAGAFDQIVSSLSDLDLTPGKNTVAVGLTLTQPIFAQGKISKGLKLAQVYYGLLDLKYKNAKLTLAKEITNAYNSALLADQNREVRQQAVALAEETHRLTRARLESGKGNVLDTLNSRFSLQQAKLALREAEKNRHLAVRNLLTIASMEADPDEVVLTDSLVIIDFNMTEEEAFKRLSDENIAIQQINKGIEMQQWQTKIVKADFLPTVFAGASVSKVSMFNTGEEFEWGDDQKIFVGATVPIFSGGQKLQKVRQADYEEQKLEETRKKTLNQLNLALASCFEELAVAKEECAEALHLIALTTQGAEIASLSYEIGQITQVDLTNSRQQLSLSKLAYNNAVHKLNAAITGIKMLIGDNSLLLAEQEGK